MKHHEFITESSLSRIYRSAKDHAVGAISASRFDKSAKSNDARHRHLGSYLSSRGYNITNITGGFVENQGTPDEHEVTERAFFVVNPVEGDDHGKLERDLIELGQLYDQDSILSYRYGDAPTYIGTTNRPDADPAFGEKFVLSATEWGNPKGPYFSSVRHRKFAYVECREWDQPQTINGKIGMYLSARNIETQLKNRI